LFLFETVLIEKKLFKFGKMIHLLKFLEYISWNNFIFVIKNKLTCVFITEMKELLLYISLGMVLFSSCKKDKTDPPTTNTADSTWNVDSDTLPINRMQWVGSHNSYKTKPDQDILNFLMNNSGILPANMQPRELDYSHETIEDQLGKYGMRSLELDFYHDPIGGKYYNRGGYALVGKPVASNIPELQQPGMKLIHIADIDFNTHHYSLKGALQAVKNWSDANPGHFPIVIMMETKEDGVGAVVPGIGFATPLAFGAGALDSLDAEIREVFGQNLDHVLTPDKVRKGANTLWEGIQQNGWPKLNECKGTVMFVMNGGSTTNDLYAAGHPSLTGRAMFTFAGTGKPESACLLIDDAKAGSETIKQRLREGYLVRTRADAGTIEARQGDYSTFEAAKNSGAQIISTDYYRPDPRGLQAGLGWTDYCAKLPSDSVIRTNPIIGPQGRIKATK